MPIVMMKKIISIYIILIMSFIFINYIIHKYIDYFDSWIWSQYSTFNTFYQTWNFTAPFSKQNLYRYFWDKSPKILKVPITCYKTWCVNPYILELESIEWEFTIRRVIVYETLEKESNTLGPYYFHYDNSLYVKKWETLLLNHNFIYDNLFWEDVPRYLPNKYWSFMFKNPIEMYYYIYPSLSRWTWSLARISLKEK